MIDDSELKRILGKLSLKQRKVNFLLDEIKTQKENLNKKKWTILEYGHDLSSYQFNLSLYLEESVKNLKNLEKLLEETSPRSLRKSLKNIKYQSFFYRK